MTGAQRLKRVFAIDIDTCRRCGGTLRAIASIEEPQVIEPILDHLARDRQSLDPAHPSRRRHTLACPSDPTRYAPSTSTGGFGLAPRSARVASAFLATPGRFAGTIERRWLATIACLFNFSGVYLFNYPDIGSFGWIQALGASGQRRPGLAGVGPLIAGPSGPRISNTRARPVCKGWISPAQ